MSQFEFVEKIEKEEWTEFANTPGVKSHFLGSFVWGEVQSERGWKTHYVGVRKDGKLVCTALVLQKMLYMGYSHLYIPRGFTMDWTDSELLAFTIKSIADFGKRLKAIYFKLDPDISPDSPAAAQLKALGCKQKPLTYYFETEQPRFTYRIYLQDELEQIEGNFSKTTKNCIKAAENNCIYVKDGSIEDIPEFVRLMKMTQTRQNFYSHEASYYAGFFEKLRKYDMINLYVGIINPGKLKESLSKKLQAAQEELDRLKIQGGKKSSGKAVEAENVRNALQRQVESLSDAQDKEIAVSAYITVNYAGKAWNLYAANDMNYGKFYSNYLVYRHQIRRAKEAGCEFLDMFGTIGKPDPSGQLNGLDDFKKKWGGKLLEFAGEFDYVLNPLMYTAFKTLIPIYRKIKLKRLKEKD